MDPISRALEGNTPLPLPLLSELGKGSLRKALADTSADQHVARNLSLWPKLVQTASSPQVNDQHITAASNALCVYLSCGGGRPLSELGQFVLSREVWFEAFHCAQKAFNNGKTKPAFQILETLCDLLQRISNLHIVADILEKASLPLVRIILLASPQADMKKACLMLSCFHRRTPLAQHLEQMVQECVQENDYTWKQRLLEHNIAVSDVSAAGKGSITHLFLALILAMVDLDTRSAALKMCTVLCNTSTEKTATPEFQTIVEQVIGLYLHRNHAALGTFAENVLPVILHTKEQLLSFIRPYAISCHDSPSRMALFIAILKVSRAKSILSESEMLDVLITGFSSPSVTSNQPDGIYWCKQLMLVADSEVQILTYGLLVSSPAGNAVASPEALDCIAFSMKYLHDHSDAHERGEILSTTKRLLRRLHNSTLAIRKSAKVPDSDEATLTLKAYMAFTRTFYHFLKDELSTGVSYSRHILSLHSLQHLFDLTVLPDLFSTDRGLVDALISLVQDPFEDVRNVATALLRTLTLDNKGLVLSALSRGLMRKVEALAIKTGRADHSDAAGRLLALRSLCFPSSNDAQLDPGGTDLVEDIRHLERLISDQGGIRLRPGCAIPIHGDLLGISYQLRYLDARDGRIQHVGSILLKVCMNVWDQVRLQLCVDSPENASEVGEEIVDEGPKDLLAFCWRALRDSSIALQSLIAVAAPSRELYKAVGDLCMDQLISLRHRGAFSTVAQTFNQCCDKIRLSADVAVRELIQDWYQVALTQIDEQASRLTRRSAGLPAMITGLLSSVDRKIFSVAIADLMAIARCPPEGDLVHNTGEMKLPQVHALNCLKDIMTNSRFAIIVAQYHESILELAANCLSSTTWAIRNCGLMLLRACINRLDLSVNLQNIDSEHELRRQGTGSGATTIAFDLLNESALGDRQLRTDPDSLTEHVFAGLDLLAHATVGGATANEVKGLVTRHLSHSNWAVRDHAALLLATRMSSRSDNPMSVLLETLKAQGLSGPENTVHGQLLYYRYLVEKAWAAVTESELRSVMAALDREMTPYAGDLILHSPYALAAWLDLVNDAASAILQHQWDYELLELRSVLNIMARISSTTTSDAASNSYVLPRFMLLGIYDVLIQDQGLYATSKRITALITRAINDPTALNFALDALRRKECHTPYRILFVFLFGLIGRAFESSALPPDVLERAFTCLTKSLEQLTDIPIDMLQALIHHIDLSRLHTPRTLRNVAVVLQGAMLGRTQTALQDSATHQCQVEQWLQVAEDCAVDEVDFPTRLSAATAVSMYIGCMVDSGFSEGAHGTRMKLLLLVYDLLNDDDEDVRLEGIKATEKLNLHKATGMGRLGYGALGAREEVLRELQVQFEGTSELAEVALLNIMRIGHHTSEFCYRAGLRSLLSTPMASKLLSISRKKNDLFAEERQNLYIDDIREMNAWVGILHNNYAAMASYISAAVRAWTLEGFKTVMLVLETDRAIALKDATGTRLNKGEVSRLQAAGHSPLPESLFGHALGVTYDHEILVLLLQAVSLAGVLYQHQRPSLNETLRGSLERVLEICSQSRVNPVLLGAIEHALRDK